MGIAILNNVDLLHIEKNNVFSYPSHAHTYYEMILYQPFDGEIVLNGIKYEIKLPTVILMTPYDIHSINVSENGKKGEFIKLQFDCELVQKLITLPEQAFVLQNPSEFLKNSIYEMFENQNMVNYCKMLICALVEMITTKGTEVINGKNSKVHTVVVNAIKIINNRFEENIGLDFVANELGITPQYLSKIFKTETGRNFNDYLCKVRLDYGAELLKSGKYDVTEACFNCGYRNLSHFMRSFKKLYGVTPKNANSVK